MIPQPDTVICAKRRHLQEMRGRGASVERGNVERGTGNVGTWERGTWERANVERGNVRTCTCRSRRTGEGHRRVACNRIRLFVLHSLTAGMAQACGTWERANVRTCNLVITSSQHGNVHVQEQAHGGGTPARGVQPHSFIRSPFVDSGDGTGMWNVGTCKRANVQSRNHVISTWERACAGAGARGRDTGAWRATAFVYSFSIR